METKKSKTTSEKEKVLKLIGNFDIEKSKSKILIENLFQRKFNSNELTILIKHCIEIKKLDPLPRDYKRSKPLLYKYMDSHFAKFEAFFSNLALIDENGAISGPKSDFIQPNQ